MLQRDGSIGEETAPLLTDTLYSYTWNHISFLCYLLSSSTVLNSISKWLKLPRCSRISSMLLHTHHIYSLQLVWRAEIYKWSYKLRVYISTKHKRENMLPAIKIHREDYLNNSPVFLFSLDSFLSHLIRVSSGGESVQSRKNCRLTLWHY